jgi:hypothetical protein
MRARRLHRLALAALALAAVPALPGCYERVVRVSDPRSRMSSYEPNVKDSHNAIDEAMYGPVPKGQDPDLYYRSKKQLMMPDAPNP